MRKQDSFNPVIKKIYIRSVVFVVLAIFSSISFAQVTFEKEIKISDGALFFDGDKVKSGAANNPNQYDYFFGNKITPHGDCVKEYKGFVFMTWYRGGESDRHVMLSRYNPNTGVVKTIEFPHRHTGYLNQPHIGESHNTIAVGVSPKDETIHLLYDMHAYSATKPSSGAFANDYFRYSYSKKNAATVPDSEFTIDLFVNSNAGNYKHLSMRDDENYVALTYPHFFVNKQGDLFMWIREGGNNNGAYKFASYDGNQWTKFTQFNMMNARQRGLAYNWGLYGDIKFENGKMRIGFARRANLRDDKYEFNNGFHYAFTDDPAGKTQWKNHLGQGFSLPLIDPSIAKISEPGDVLNVSGKNSVVMTAGADWTVTEDEDIHFVSLVMSADRSRKINVHTYKKASGEKFETSTDFPGGSLYAYKNNVYLIGLEGGAVFVEKTEGGTNDWKRIYTGDKSGRKFRHGVVHISDGKLYYYLMEQKSSSAQPIYLQIIDLGLDGVTSYAPDGFTFAVNEGDRLSVERPLDIAYGAEGNYIFRTNQRSDILCANSVCTKDPAPGTEKACYVRESKTAYNMNYAGVPGVIEAEHYDYGGQGISYFDSSPEQNKGTEVANIRPDEGVDVTSGNGGAVVSWIGAGEWLEYSIFVQTAGDYDVRLLTSAVEAEGLVSLSLDGNPLLTNLVIPPTGNVDMYKVSAAQANLPQGRHVMRVHFEAGDFNLDSIEFREVK